MSLFNHFLRSSGLYFLGNILAKLVGFFLLPVYTIYISPDKLGYFDISNTYLNLVTTVLFLDIYVGIMRFVYDERKTANALKPVFNGGVIFFTSLLVYSLFALVIWIYCDLPYLLYIYVYGVCLVFNNLYGYLARTFKQNSLFAFSGVGATLLTGALTFVGLAYFNCGIEILFLASTLGLLFQIVIIEMNLPVSRKLHFSMFDKKLLLSLYRYSLPLCLNSLAFWFLTGFGNIMISQKLGLEQNGIYLIAIKFALVINLVSMCFNLAWQELVFEKGNEDKESLGLFYSKAVNLLICFLCIGSLCLIHFSYVIFPFMVADTYSEAFALIPMSVLAASLAVLSSFLGQIYAALKKTHIIMYSTAAASLVNIVCVCFLISSWGIKGVLISLIISYCISIIMRIFMIRNTVCIRLNCNFLYVFVFMLSISVLFYYWGGIVLNVVGLFLFFGIGLYYQRKFISEIVCKINNSLKK